MKRQVWIAVSVYILVAIVKRELANDRSLNEILQILSLTLFEKTPILRARSGDYGLTDESDFHNPLPMFDF